MKVQIVEAVKSQKKRATGHQCPVTLYTRTKSNNHTPSVIEILDGAGSVHQTPYAEIIETVKKGTEAEGVDPLFLWQGFHLLNQRNANTVAPLSWLIAFVRKAKPIYNAHKNKPVVHEGQPVYTDTLILMAQPARFENRAFHQRDLIRKIGQQAYETRITAIQARYGIKRLAAQLAVHGQAVKAGGIAP